MREASTVVEADGLSAEIAWLDWGEEGAKRTVVCAHGLTRNAHDFDHLATALQDRCRVLAVDVPGRGRSARLPDPTQYTVPVYAGLLKAWLDRLGLARVDWIGTSMGGLIGMTLTAADPARVDRLVLNDIGAFIPKAGLEPLTAYVGLDPRFASLDEAEAYLRRVHAPFGPLSDADWRHLAEHGVVRDDDGYRLRYDPAITVPGGEDGVEDIDLWPLYEAISCPTLLLRGANSTLLDAETADAMTRRGPKATLVTFEGIGHAPALMAPDQIAAIETFLRVG